MTTSPPEPVPKRPDPVLGTPVVVLAVATGGTAIAQRIPFVRAVF